MADEAKDQDATSNNGNKPGPAAAPASTPTEASQIADAVILEERITRVPPKSTQPEKVPAAPAPGAMNTPPAHSAPAAMPAPVNIPALVHAPPPAVQAPEPRAEAARPAPPQPHDSTTPNTDIAQILKEVKLPERYDQKGAADTKTPAPDTSSTPAPEAAPIATSAPPGAGESHTQEKRPETVSSVHTLKDDLQGIVRDQKMSVVRAVSLEEDRRAREKKQATPEMRQRAKRTSAVLFAVMFLFVLGGGAILGVYIVMQQRASAPSQQTASSILFAERSVTFPLSDRSVGNLKRELGGARNASTGALGSITRIIPFVTTSDPDGTTHDAPATFAEYMHALGAHIPDDLLRALGSDFFFGLHTVDENAPILIIPVTSYDRAFAGMLAWEGAMNTDLAPVFTDVPALTTDQNGIPSERRFQDRIMRNHDVRALLDDRGEIQLYYSFPDENTLIIAESPYSFTEILSRLQAGRNLQ